MKNVIILSLFSFILISCSSSNTFYQLVKVESDDLNSSLYGYVYENDDVLVTYNFWSNHGNPGFKVFNKSDRILFVNLKNSFFIKNGIVYDYYKARSFSTSEQGYISETSDFTNDASIYSVYKQYQGVDAMSYAESRSVGLETSEQQYISIPPKSARFFSEYTILISPLINCDVERFPDEDEIQEVNYNKNDTPLTFRNFISYTLNSNSHLEDQKTIDNSFWISEVTHYPSDMFLTSRYRNICGEEVYDIVYNFTYKSPLFFYISYTY